MRVVLSTEQPFYRPVNSLPRTERSADFEDRVLTGKKQDVPSLRDVVIRKYFPTQSRTADTFITRLL